MPSPMPAEKRKAAEFNTSPDRVLFNTAQEELDAILAEYRTALKKGDKELVGLLKRRQELFWAEHDNAGAFKIKKFDRHLREEFSGRGGKEAAIARKPDGSFEASPAEKQKRFLFVDMLEL